jgi:hypothetical protein
MVRGSNSPIWPAGTESLPNQALAQVLCHRYQLWTAMQHMQLFEEQGTLQRVRGRPKSGIRSWPSWGAFVRVEGFRVEFDRVAEQPPFSKSLRTNIRLRSGNFPATVLILHLAESLCNFIATRGARQSLSENSRPCYFLFFFSV